MTLKIPRIGPISTGIWILNPARPPSPIVPVPCSTALPALAASVWDTGNIALPGGSPMTFPNGFLPPAARPYVAIALWDARRTDTSAMNHGGVSSFSNYVDDAKIIPDFPSSDIAHQAIFGHYGFGSGGIPPSLIANFTPSWTGGWTGGDSTTRVIGCLVPTAAGAPTQIGPATGSGGISNGVTFPAPVSAGNIVIAAFVCEIDDIPLPGGWTDIIRVTMPVGFGSGTHFALIGKCVNGTEGNTLLTFDSGRPHWWMGAEIALT